MPTNAELAAIIADLQAKVDAAEAPTARADTKAKAAKAAPTFTAYRNRVSEGGQTFSRIDEVRPGNTPNKRRARVSRPMLDAMLADIGVKADKAKLDEYFAPMTQDGE